MKIRECMKGELDLFQNPLVQYSVLKTEEIAYYPVNSLDQTSQIEFRSLGNAKDTYRDLSSVYLRLKVQLVKENGSAFTTIETQPLVVNNILHSLFQSVSLSLNGKVITNSDQNYAYRAYMENILNYGTDASNTHLKVGGWNMHSSDADSTDDEGNKNRSIAFKNSSVVELIGKVHLDMLNQKLYLINGVDAQFRFALSKPEFYLIGNAGKLKVLEAVLYINHVTLDPAIITAHNSVLQHTNAKYYYSTVEVKSITLSANTYDIHIDNAIIGKIPKRIIVGFVDNDAFTGSLSKSPFNFKHYNMSKFNLIVNGVTVPSQPIEMKFDGDKSIIARAYHTLYKGTSINYQDRGHQITPETFRKGSFLLAFDLTPDFSGDSNCTNNLMSDGVISIQAKLSSPLGNAITVIIYSEYDTAIEISLNRQILGPF